MPTHVAGPEVQQDPIRLKNLLSEANDKLLQLGLDQQRVEQVLKPGFALLENDRFWRYQSQGLALFFTPDRLRVYRLPLEFESLVVVGDRFHLKPLLPLFFGDRYFYLLALSQNQVRFFQATRYRISEISLSDTPTSLAEALKYDDPEEQLQYHSGGGQGSAPTYHGQGGGSDDENFNLLRFLAKVEKGLHAYLKDEHAPLVIASVDYLQPLYHQVNSYPHLLAEGVSGNPDQAQPDDLRAAAWEQVAPLVEQAHQAALSTYNNVKGTGKASDRLSQLLPAAFRGQVDVLFTQANAHCWGQFDPDSGQVDHHAQPQPDDQDLLDLAAVQTFLQGGDVYLLAAEAMPTQAPAAAVYRYGIPAGV
ncbi:hypothetical protein [Nodosilinea nodulosa]|uniref:baeRF7 domain-containing protein n=1 Tax=Nodosilinea nodulosa TaxID=416001 RepID=UPI00037AED14|nr:hypothetical protein [Nodosilinea nodulosa]